MHTFRTYLFFFVAIAAALAHAELASAQTPRFEALSDLPFAENRPTEETAHTLRDELLFQRATQAYLWALPLMAMQQWQSEHLTKFGAGKLDYVDYLTFQDKLGLVTANATTPYSMAFPNLKETGPLVFEVPAGPTAGGFTDFWQRPITDSGQTGPYKGAGGKYLILGPDDPDHTQLDERTNWFYEAVGVSVGMMGRAVGVGQVYLEAAKDSQGRWLDGGGPRRHA